MRSILLHVADDSGMEARLQVALDLARGFGAHITCLQPVAVDFAVPGDLYGTMIAELIPVIQKNADAVRERLGARLQNEDVTWDWRQEEGPERQLLMRAEVLADIVVLGTRDSTGDRKGPSGLAAYMAVHGHSPLLVVPETTLSFDLAGAIVIGWNGSHEAGHALRSAVPLLQKAASVILANVTEDIHDPRAFLPSVGGAEYLSRHGIACEILEIEPDGRSVARALTKAATARGAAFIVGGAYGHSRALETVFGGVTRELFTDPPLPIFTAH